MVAASGPLGTVAVLRLFSRERPPEPFPDLTSREREILDLMAAGASNAEMARKLFLSPKTVSNNVS
jgi:DNA-binding NarL/FixJ family response regulator